MKRQNTLLFRLLEAVLVAFVAMRYGNRDTVLSSMLRDHFLVVFFFYLFLSFTCFYIIRRFNAFFDRTYGWGRYWYIRLVYQVLTCWALPMLIVFGVARVFFRISGLNIFATEFFHADMMLAAVCLATINLAHAVAYFRSQVLRLRDKLKTRGKTIAQLKEALVELKKQTDTIEKALVEAQIELNVKADALQDEQPNEMTYRIEEEDRVIIYRQLDIDYFFIEHRAVFLQLSDRGMEGDSGKGQALTKITALETVAADLDPVFKRISKKYVVGEHALRRCIKLEKGKLKLFFGSQNIDEILSKARAMELEDWILRKIPIESQRRSRNK